MTVAASILAARAGSDEPVLRRVFTFSRELFDTVITTTDLVVYAAILLGVTCGLLGCFIVLRRRSLLGDAIGHSVLPGVCIGFLLTSGRGMPSLLLGALVFGLVAALLIALVQRTTLLKTGESMGVVFTGFYGLGIVLLTLIQNLHLDRPLTATSSLADRFFHWLAAVGVISPFNSGQAGLDRFLFGQIIGISPGDVRFMAIIAIVTIVIIIANWRALAAWSFDEGFARGIGLPVALIDNLMTVLMTVAIVISIQAVGVVLVSAMLVTPAATAYLLTDRLHRMAILAAAFGAAAGVLGAFASLFGDKLPTGSLMVLAASLLFALAFFLSPRHGVLPRARRVWQRRRRTQAENLLRTLWGIMENRGGGKVDTRADRRFGVYDVAATRQESPAQVRTLWRRAAGFGWVEPASADPMIVTDDGLEEARRVVRNHRLWELFLTQEAQLAADHVHADAEHIEHVLPKDVLRRLEQMLDHPVADPHGKPIP